MRISHFPRVSLKIRVENNSLVSTLLSLHTSFDCSIEGGSQEVSKLLFEWLYQYANGSPSSLKVPFKLDSLSLFQKSVLQALQEIPFGQVRSYSELAKSSGSPRAYRAAGTACKRNPFPLLIPCHRIIQADGGIGGFALNLEIKKRLLEFEGKSILPS